MSRHANRKVDIAKVMVYCASPRVPSQEIDAAKVQLGERVLVASNYNDWAIAVEKEDMCLRQSRKQICFEGEVKMGIC